MRSCFTFSKHRLFLDLPITNISNLSSVALATAIPVNFILLFLPPEQFFQILDNNVGSVASFQGAVISVVTLALSRLMVFKLTPFLKKKKKNSNSFNGLVIV